MTDNKIIKALECCTKTEFISDCAKCEMLAFDCKDTLIENALNLINHQKAEIERLENELKITREYIHDNNLEFDLLTKIKHNSLCETETYESR